MLLSCCDVWMVLQEGLNYLCGMEESSCSLKGGKHTSAEFVQLRVAGLVS